VKTAIIHEWLTIYAGSEKALEQIVGLYPESDFFCVVDYLSEQERKFLAGKAVRTSFVQSLPFAKTKYRSYLPLMPMAVERFDLSAYELVISSSHAVAKGVLTDSNQVHICYCYTPMRYAWDLQDQYLRESGLDRGLKGMFARMVLRYMRRWDYASSRRVDHFVAISQYIADRIKKAYNRDAAVIYPPVNIDTFTLRTEKEDFYLTASRMVPYKKIDLIVEAFSRMPDKRLVVIGDGPDFRKIKSKAGRNVELLGHQHTAILKEYLQKARAFVFAAEEDFGIVAVEAQACGTPVIAYGKGGVLETTIDRKTGLFFPEQTVKSLSDTVHEFEKVENTFDSLAIRKNAERFSEARFRKEFKEFVDRIVSDKA
jgi:O-antigen biosynthesis alpha-1,3-mannosyltransferase